MHNKKRLYLYPLTKTTGKPGANTYIINLRNHLKQRFNVVNKPTGLGLLDVVLKMSKTDIIYFNWIEDVVDKRFGVFQVHLLRLILWLSKRFNTTVVWLIHNNVSHTQQNLKLKKHIVALMTKHANVVLSHSSEARVPRSFKKIAVFDHPVDLYTPVPVRNEYEYDLLLWGTVNPYKGVEEFLQFAQTRDAFKNIKILVAGKFATTEYYERIAAMSSPNVTIVNKILTDEELVSYFSKSQYVLFTYTSSSVLSSGALCKTLSYGKTIIGPHRGSFKELGVKNLIYTYTDFNALENLLAQITPKELNAAHTYELQEYIRQHSWTEFVSFIDKQISGKSVPRLSPIV